MDLIKYSKSAMCPVKREEVYVFAIVLIMNYKSKEMCTIKAS